MFERLIEQKTAISMYLTERGSNERNSLPELGWRDWLSISELTDILEPLYSATTQLCDEEYVTISMLIP